ncbi:MAG TPA: amylo-alpha-1,6-glucosidase, partial [Cyclobacteriaceae bacterium]|nr:amylo-alpha-1,6-glucosidase [Cyclobacteriaceae bacterium]
INDDLKNEDIRPNQIYALSLPFVALSKDKAKKTLKVVSEKLLTPHGLRSLSKDHPDYKPFYRGDIWQRDNAYHQGTVWSHLLGPYIDAVVHVKGQKGRVEASRIVTTFLSHLDEVCIGSISEIFDGDPPHHPRGAIAQAWSVGELLRVCTEYQLLD